MTAISKDLTDLTILVTRPDPAGSALCDQIRSHGGEAIHLPTIEFSQAPDQQAFDRSIEVLNEQDWLVFVSPRAVYASIPAIRRRWPLLPPHVKLTAIGAGTAEALHQAGYQVDAFPEKIWNSESFVEMPELQNISNKKIAIIRGEGGREVLEKLLGERGANVLSVLAYSRMLPSIKKDKYISLLKRHEIDAVVCASYEAVRNLKMLLGEEAWSYLKIVPLIVISERIKALARTLGFQTIWVASNASHESVLHCLMKKKDEICQIKEMRM